jgi:hypothetical protein
VTKERVIETRGPLTEEVNVDVELDIEVEQCLVALVTHVAASNQRVVRPCGPSHSERSWSGSRSRASQHAEGQHEESEGGEAGESGLELHGAESGESGERRRVKS